MLNRDQMNSLSRLVKLMAETPDCKEKAAVLKELDNFLLISKEAI